ncbi:MAG: hypothetical protein J5689_01170 [Clostridia bacterium]|nr:hypothetical protein [Clostridia bacterium]
MKNLDRFSYIALFDAYKTLLTEKQQQILTLYYFNDFGLTEIGENLGVSRQAVLDAIKKAETVLVESEKSLKLVEKSKKVNVLLDSIKTSDQKTKEVIKEIKDLI